MGDEWVERAPHSWFRGKLPFGKAPGKGKSAGNASLDGALDLEGGEGLIEAVPARFAGRLPRLGLRLAGPAGDVKFERPGEVCRVPALDCLPEAASPAEVPGERPREADVSPG